MRPQSLDLLLQSVHKASRVLILPHNDPDPDAIASAYALRELFVDKLSLECTIAFQGIVGRAENKALVEYLDNPLRHIKHFDFQDDIPVVLVDTQPDAGNNPLPPGRHVTAVIDHHFHTDTVIDAPFIDVRPHYGATSTILTEYMRSARVTITQKTATALFYGIKTDTRGLARSASRADVRAYFFLQSKLDVEALAKIERAQVPPDYFRSLDKALHSARWYKNGLVNAFLGDMGYPDLVAEIAELLLRLQNSQWIVCSGVYDDTLMISVRSRNAEVNAADLVKAMVDDDGTAGGHNTLAGGQIPIDDKNVDTICQSVNKRLLTFLDVPPSRKGEPII